MTSEETGAQIRSSVERGERISVEVVKYNSSGKPYWAELSIQPVIGENGMVEHIFSIEKDITARKILELDLERTNKEITTQNERLHDFAYMVSHNVRAPLANLKGMGEMLIDEIVVTPANQNLMDFFRKAVQGLENVIDHLQELVEVKEEHEEWKDLGLLEMFQYVSDQLKLDLESAGVRWEIDFLKAPEVYAAWTFLYNIFYNLISNSVKYRASDRTPEISISSDMVDGNIVLIFQDNGRGMDLQQVGDRLFTHGGRFHPDVAGTGKGLYLVKQQVNRMGGSIEVESSPDQGASFTIRIPVPKAEPAADE